MEILEAVCKVLKEDINSIEINISFINGEEIKELNNKFRNIDKVTDVLSFPDGDINPESNKRFLGDVLICKEVAEKQAEEFGHPIAREMAFLQVHGILHLFGYDHMNEDDEAKMRGLQREIMALLS